ncbi:MAG TPA: NBR1-Ig-like domain-containing protein, partial [Anaerolineales bacterium]|nr:NBR1-Ig-like domain-containing protein [Anaerolineales bacterium]
MAYPRFQKLALTILLLIPVLACQTFAGGTPQPAETLNSLYTSAAQTLAAISTDAVFTQTAQPLASNTLAVSSASPGPSSTAANTSTSVPITRCDAASFVTDVTYADGSVVGRGSSFTKIWRLKNVGTCTWTTSYSIMFVSGERFESPASVSMPANVTPGQTIDLAINLVAPVLDGRYRGNWKLRNASGVLFGIGSSADSNFYVDVNVSGYTLSALDFVADACSAIWRSDTGTLPCPGAEGDNHGFVRVLNAPKMEDGASRGPGLLTYPNRSGSGLITAKFDNFNVRTGDRFQALIGCEYRATDCNVIFRLQYQIGNGDIRTLGEWREVYEGQYYPVNVDLRSLNGERVKFILTVLANGTSHDDFALWVNPRITRQSAQPATATSTL